MSYTNLFLFFLFFLNLPYFCEPNFQPLLFFTFFLENDYLDVTVSSYCLRQSFRASNRNLSTKKKRLKLFLDSFFKGLRTLTLF